MFRISFIFFMLISISVKSQIFNPIYKSTPTNELEYFEKEIAIERRAGLIGGLVIGTTLVTTIVALANTEEGKDFIKSIRNFFQKEGEYVLNPETGELERIEPELESE